MIGERNLAPDRGPNVWTRDERDEEAWRDPAASPGERSDRDTDEVASESAASFPASDSPSWTPVHGVSPRDRAARPASLSTRQALGGSGGIHVAEQVVIERPAAEVFRFWRDLANLSKFMGHVQSVTTDGRRSHWVVRGPLGTTVEWDAEINHEIENKVIGWQTLADATVTHAGSVNFDEVPGGTRLRVKLQYDPPAGRVGGAVARLLGEDPAQQIREDLQRVKELLEHA